MIEDIVFNKAPDVEFLSFGHEQRPVIVFDNFLRNPEKLLDYAEQGADFQATPSDYYPGIRKSIGGNFPETLCRVLAPYLESGFDQCLSGDPRVDLCALSMTTTHASCLRPIQSLPHFDTSDGAQLAVIHYLCGPEFGGTSFYRHRQTGFESITAERVQAYASTLKAEVVAARFPGQRYVNGDSTWFERTASIKAKFNRAIVFPGNVLHSGDINTDCGLSREPRRGRLTANTFINFSTQ